MKAEKFLALFCIIVVAIAAYYGSVALEVGAGYSAKVVCSATFTAKRDFDTVLEEEVGLSVPIYTVSKGERSVTCEALFGLIKRVATYNPVRNSCTLVAPGKDSTVWDNVGPLSPPLVSSSGDSTWPNGDEAATLSSHAKVNSQELEKLMDAAFHEPVLKEAGIFRKTRALLVLYEGKIIAERYAEGLDSSTPLLGWSMTKSLISLLFGARVQDEKISLNQSDLFPEWGEEKDDKRAEITVDQLLRASSGLEFRETNDPLSDTSKMLFRSDSPVPYALEKPLKHDIDTTWSYSSGTSNLLSQILRNSFASDGGDNEYWNYPKKFFSKISMNSLVMDTDNTGTFIGSSFAYATLRDWARFGLFALQKGQWNGEQILPESWFDYALTPTPTAPKGQYGAHWWLNAGARGNSADRYFPSIPEDAFFALGYQGQSVSVIPSRDIVVVRLGHTSPKDAWNLEGFLNHLLEHVISA